MAQSLAGLHQPLRARPLLCVPCIATRLQSDPYRARRLGTSRAETDPHNFQPSRSIQLCGLRTINGSYVSRIGHMKSLPSSSFQSGNEIALEKGSTSHVLASPCRSSRCFLQLFKTYESAWRARVGDVITSR